jgi:ribosomal protein S27E
MPKINYKKMREMNGQFDVTCTGCGNPIERGTRVYISKNGNIYHVSCGDHLVTKRLSYV